MDTVSVFEGLLYGVVAVIQLYRVYTFIRYAQCTFYHPSELHQDRAIRWIRRMLIRQPFQRLAVMVGVIALTFFIHWYLLMSLLMVNLFFDFIWSEIAEYLIRRHPFLRQALQPKNDLH